MQEFWTINTTKTYQSTKPTKNVTSKKEIIWQGLSSTNNGCFRFMLQPWAPSIREANRNKHSMLHCKWWCPRFIHIFMQQCNNKGNGTSMTMSQRCVLGSLLWRDLRYPPSFLAPFKAQKKSSESPGVSLDAEFFLHLHMGGTPKIGGKPPKWMVYSGKPD